jgi:hypothetical protein
MLGGNDQPCWNLIAQPSAITNDSGVQFVFDPESLKRFFSQTGKSFSDYSISLWSLDRLGVYTHAQTN